jgi:hypothetical protein
LYPEYNVFKKKKKNVGGVAYGNAAAFYRKQWSVVTTLNPWQLHRSGARFEHRIPTPADTWAMTMVHNDIPMVYKLM